MEKIALPLNLNSSLAVYEALAKQLKNIANRLEELGHHATESDKLLTEAEDIIQGMQSLSARIDELTEG